jgi:hypothetical protein
MRGEDILRNRRVWHTLNVETNASVSYVDRNVTRLTTASDADALCGILMIAVNGSVIQGLAQGDFDMSLTSGDAT